MQIRSSRSKSSIQSNYTVEKKDANKVLNFALQVFTDTNQATSYLCKPPGTIV